MLLAGIVYLTVSVEIKRDYMKVDFKQNNKDGNRRKKECQKLRLEKTGIGISTE